MEQLTASRQEEATLRVSAAGDADGFVVDLQADGAGVLALHALCRGAQRARAAARLLLLRAELGARRDKAPKHRHHGAGEDLQLSTTARWKPRKCSDCRWRARYPLSRVNIYRANMAAVQSTYC